MRRFQKGRALHCKSICVKITLREVESTSVTIAKNWQNPALSVLQKVMHSNKAKAEFELGQNSNSQQQNIEIDLKSLGLDEAIGARLGDPSAGRTPCMIIMNNDTPHSYIPLGWTTG